MLELNISTILLEMANFIILAFILYRFLFTPLQKTLKKRAIETTKTWDEATAAKAKAEETIQQYEEKTNNIDAEIAARKNEARMIIDQTRQQMLHEVQAEIESLQAQAKETFALMRNKALQQHEEEIGDMASEFASGIMKDLSNPQLQKIYREEFLNKISQMDISEYLGETPLGDTAYVKVVMASPPTTSYQDNLESILKQGVSQKLEFTYEVDENIIAGGILQFENELVDGSIQGQINQFKKRYQENV